jgi:hypothetical protein
LVSVNDQFVGASLKVRHVNSLLVLGVENGLDEVSLVVLNVEVDITVDEIRQDINH